MNKKTLLLRLIVLTCLIIALFFGMHLANVNNSLKQSNECLLTNNVCSFSSETMSLRIKFLQAPAIEEELFINFDISKGYVIAGAWVEGENMYMGKTPIIFENIDNKKTNKGFTFLGSCTQPDMQWKLYIEVKSEAGETSLYSAFFNTRLN